MESILLENVLRCRRQGIKVVISDTVSVQKTSLTATALPQYIFDQRLEDVVLIVFLDKTTLAETIFWVATDSQEAIYDIGNKLLATNAGQG